VAAGLGRFVSSSIETSSDAPGRTRVGEYVLIRPGGQPSSISATLAHWCGVLSNKLTVDGHTLASDVHGQNRQATETALSGSGSVVFFFGHGVADALLDADRAVLIDQSNIVLANGKSLAAVACDSARDLGTEAVQQGVTCYLGFETELPVFRVGAQRPDLLQLIVDALAGLGKGVSFGDVCADLKHHFKWVGDYYSKTGRGAAHPNRQVLMFAARALEGLTVAKGDETVTL
jgi:hypothetical protein